MSRRLTLDQKKDLKLRARQMVRGGYDSPEEIEEYLLEMAEGYDNAPSEGTLLKHIRNMIVDEILQLKDEEVDWPILTDNDRLELAFDQLEDSGIVAREHFTCCSNCGAAEIGTEIEDYEAGGATARGYIFFHEQDTDTAVEGKTIWMSFGAAHGNEDADHLAIGQEIVNKLEAVGLKPVWNGEIKMRIGCLMNWQRRWQGNVPSPIKRWQF